MQLLTKGAVFYGEERLFPDEYSFVCFVLRRCLTENESGAPKFSQSGVKKMLPEIKNRAKDILFDAYDSSWGKLNYALLI
jgi:hypothetical protein